MRLDVSVGCLRVGAGKSQFPQPQRMHRRLRRLGLLLATHIRHKRDMIERKVGIAKAELELRSCGRRTREAKLISNSAGLFLTLAFLLENALRRSNRGMGNGFLLQRRLSREKLDQLLGHVRWAKETLCLHDGVRLQHCMRSPYSVLECGERCETCLLSPAHVLERRVQVGCPPGCNRQIQ